MTNTNISQSIKTAAEKFLTTRYFKKLQRQKTAKTTSKERNSNRSLAPQILKATVRKTQPHSCRGKYFGPSKTQHFLSQLSREKFWNQIRPNVLLNYYFQIFFAASKSQIFAYLLLREILGSPVRPNWFPKFFGAQLKPKLALLKPAWAENVRDKGCQVHQESGYLIQKEFFSAPRAALGEFIGTIHPIAFCAFQLATKRVADAGGGKLAGA